MFDVIKREPALFIGGLSSFLAEVIVIVSAHTGTKEVVLALLPVVSAFAIRFFVSPAEKPGL